MYKLIIADDEEHIRAGLREVIDWEALGFTPVDVLEDGQEVIECLDIMLPDVLLMDIKMNYVSGIEVASYVAEHGYPCKIVLLSGYQEFELARQALMHGVEAYLLKPTDVKELKRTFMDLKKKLDDSRESRKRMNDTIKLLEEHFWADIVLGIVKSEAYVERTLEMLYPGQGAFTRSFILVDITISDYEYYMSEIWEYTYDQLQENLKNFLKLYEDGYRFHIVYKSHGLIELIGVGMDPLGENDPPEGVLERLKRQMEENFGFLCEISLLGCYSGMRQLMNRNVQHCGEKNFEQMEAQYLAEKNKQIISNIVIGNITVAQKLFHDLLYELDNFEKEKRNNIVVELMSMLYMSIAEHQWKLAESLRPLMNYVKVSTAQNVHEIIRLGDRLFDHIRLHEDFNNNYKLVMKAKNMIKKNICEDVSLEKVAESLYICPSYLSRIFQRESGVSFSQYVLAKKIDKAIELLKDPQYRLYHVAEKLGYKKPGYFAKIFQAHTGMNPSEYRRKVLHVEQEAGEP